MEKLDLQEFRKIKQEAIDLFSPFFKKLESGEVVEENTDNLSGEEIERIISRYNEIIRVLSEHDLSDIGFEEWQGMILISSSEIPIDFSRTRANLDFSLITMEAATQTTEAQNLKGCKIRNFDFERILANPDTFDEEFIQEHAAEFLSNDVPEDVRKRFYEGDLTLQDIKGNDEVKEKVRKKNINHGLVKLFVRLGKEEFLKLDAEFIDEVCYDASIQIILENPDLKTAEEIMREAYKLARETMLSNEWWLGVDCEKLGQTFKEQNPDIYLSDDTPEEVKTKYYHRNLHLEDLCKYLEYFEGKKVIQALGSWEDVTAKMVKLYGEDITQLVKEYRPIMTKITEETWRLFYGIEIPDRVLTEEERRNLISRAITSNYRVSELVKNMQELKMLLNLTSIEMLKQSTNNKFELLQKYNIDDFIKANIDVNVFLDKNVTELEQIKKLATILKDEDIEQYIFTGLNVKEINSIKKYGIDKLIEFGIEDIREGMKPVTDLYKIKEVIDKKIPSELINYGEYTDAIKKFIHRYGIDNIIALDKETNGMFSHIISGNNKRTMTYLSMLAYADKDNIDSIKELNQSEIEDEMFKVLVKLRDTQAFRQGDIPKYGFIQGKFREKYQEIFIDDSIADELKDKFYRKKMTAEDLREHPEIVKALKGKDLSRVFAKEIMVGSSAEVKGENGQVRGFIPAYNNFATEIINRVGEDNFFKVCIDYGKCLDNIIFELKENDTTEETLRNRIEDIIYKTIKTKSIEYFEELPDTFKNKHPELFLPKEVNEELRKKFYAGRLTYEDVRKNPQLKELLLTKDISVGFSGLKYGAEMLGSNGKQRYINPMWEKLSEQEIMDFAEEYGDYLIDVPQDIFVDGQTREDRIKAIRECIEYNILNSKNEEERIIRPQRFGHPITVIKKKSVSLYNENVPKFFKTEHPELFLDSNAPEELKQCFYDGGIITFKQIKEHPEWREFLVGKNLQRAFDKNYTTLFTKFDKDTMFRLGSRYGETVDKMVEMHKEDILEMWYKATGGKFIPHQVIMENFPAEEIDNFLANSKQWSQLMQIDRYKINDDVKAAILKLAYSMGVFHGQAEGFNITKDLLTRLPRTLTREEYEQALKIINDDSEKKSLLEEAYQEGQNGVFSLRINTQKEKNKAKEIRTILEETEVQRINNTSQIAYNFWFF